MKRFAARLEPEPHGGCFVVVPDDVAAAARVKYKDRVRGTVDGVAYRSSLMKKPETRTRRIEKTIATWASTQGDRRRAGG